MTKKKLALVIVAVIAVIGIIVGVVMFTSSGDKIAGNGNETSSTTSVSDTASKEDTTSTDTTSKEDNTSTTSKENTTTTTDTSSDTTSTTSKDNTTSKTEPSTPSTTNPEQGKEGDRPMAEVVKDTITLSNGKELKIEDLILLEKDIVLTADGGMLPDSYKKWADRIGIPDEDLVTYYAEGYGTVIDCGGTMENILRKNGYTDEAEIQSYLGKLGY